MHLWEDAVCIVACKASIEDYEQKSAVSLCNENSAFFAVLTLVKINKKAH